MTFEDFVEILKRYNDAASYTYDAFCGDVAKLEKARPPLTEENWIERLADYYTRVRKTSFSSLFTFSRIQQLAFASAGDVIAFLEAATRDPEKYQDIVNIIKMPTFWDAYYVPVNDSNITRQGINGKFSSILIAQKPVFPLLRLIEENMGKLSYAEGFMRFGGTDNGGTLHATLESFDIAAAKYVFDQYDNAASNNPDAFLLWARGKTRVGTSAYFLRFCRLPDYVKQEALRIKDGVTTVERWVDDIHDAYAGGSYIFIDVACFWSDFERKLAKRSDALAFGSWITSLERQAAVWKCLIDRAAEDAEKHPDVLAIFVANATEADEGLVPIFQRFCQFPEETRNYLLHKLGDLLSERDHVTICNILDTFEPLPHTFGQGRHIVRNSRFTISPGIDCRQRVQQYDTVSEVFSGCGQEAMIHKAFLDVDETGETRLPPRYSHLTTLGRIVSEETIFQQIKDNLPNLGGCEDRDHLWGRIFAYLPSTPSTSESGGGDTTWLHHPLAGKIIGLSLLFDRWMESKSRLSRIGGAICLYATCGFWQQNDRARQMRAEALQFVTQMHKDMEKSSVESRQELLTWSKAQPLFYQHRNDAPFHRSETTTMVHLRKLAS